MRDDPELDIIRKRGFEHEKRYLADLAADGRTSVEITPDGSIEDRGDQLARRRRRDHRGHGLGRGRHLPGDLLRRHVARPRGLPAAGRRPGSAVRWGPWHYEVADTKLARHVKASAVLQICSYIDQLERIQGVGPEWMYVALGGSARAVEPFRVDDFMAYYRGAQAAVPRDGRGRDHGGLPARGSYPEPVGALRRLPLGRRVRRPPAGRRPPVPRRRHQRAPAPRPRSARGHDPRGLRRPARADPAADRGAPARPRWSASTSRRASSSRAGAPATGRCTSCCCPSRANRSTRSAASRRCRRRRPATSSSTSKATRSRSTTASTTSSASSTWTAHSTPSGRATTTASSPWPANGAAFEQLMDFIIDRLRARPRPARLPLRPVRADRAQAPDGPLRDARGRGRSPCSRGGVMVDLLRVVRQGAPRVGRELLHQEAGAVLRLHPRDRAARRGLQHRRVRAVARAAAKASGRQRTTSSTSSATTATTS